MIGTGAKTDAQLFFPSSNGGAKTPAAQPSSPAPASPASSVSSKSEKPGAALRSTQSSSTRLSVIIQPARPRASTIIKEQEMAAVDELNSQTMVDKVDVVAIDRIFSHSAQLNPDAIVEFVTHLCAVSREELASPTDPQVYSLQKIVEIAYYNMSRVRLVWARIWEVLGEFFTEVGQHHNLSIAMYAVDSLRQLSAKFLEKGELLNYQFQREFLKPFVDLMGETSSREIKELILGCLGHMAQSRAKSIRSGWRPMLDVFAIAASEPSLPICTSGFELLHRTLNELFDLLSDHHVECATCLCAYLHQKPHEAIALQAADCLRVFAGQISAPAAAPAADAPAAERSASSGAADGASAADGAPPVSTPSGQEKVWWPLLQGLAMAVHDERVKVRSLSLTVLFDIVQKQLAEGGALEGELAERAFRDVLLPIFAMVPADPETQLLPAELEWLGGTGLAALQKIEESFCTAYGQVSTLLEDVMALLVRCLQQRQHGAMAQVAANSLLHLVEETGCHFSQETWTSVCAELKSCFKSGEGEPIDEVVPPPDNAAASPLLREVSAKVEAEAPPGSGPHELQASAARGV